MAAATVVTVACAACGHRLGTVGMSAVQMKLQPVWQVEPGWRIAISGPLRGILDRSDHAFESERRLSHEMTGNQRAPERVMLGREIDITDAGLCVRCPNCHRLRVVTPRVLYRPV